MSRLVLAHDAFKGKLPIAANMQLDAHYLDWYTERHAADAEPFITYYADLLADAGANLKYLPFLYDDWATFAPADSTGLAAVANGILPTPFFYAPPQYPTQGDLIRTRKVVRFLIVDTYASRVFGYDFTPFNADCLYSEEDVSQVRLKKWATDIPNAVRTGLAGEDVLVAAHMPYGLFASSWLAFLAPQQNIGDNFLGHDVLNIVIFTHTNLTNHGVQYWGVNKAVGTVISITDATNTTPIVVTVSPDHGEGDAHGGGGDTFAQFSCSISGVTGNTAANGNWRAKRVSSSELSLYDVGSGTIPSVGSGAYAGGGSLTYSKTIAFSEPVNPYQKSFSGVSSAPTDEWGNLPWQSDAGGGPYFSPTWWQYPKACNWADSPYGEFNADWDYDVAELAAAFPKFPGYRVVMYMDHIRSGFVTYTLGVEDNQADTNDDTADDFETHLQTAATALAAYNVSYGGRVNFETTAASTFLSLITTHFGL